MMVSGVLSRNYQDTNVSEESDNTNDPDSSALSFKKVCLSSNICTYMYIYVHT